MNEKNCDLSYYIFKNNTVEFLFDGNKALITENSDFWRLHLDDGFEYEIPCYSSYQKDYEIFNDGNETVVYISTMLPLPSFSIKNTLLLKTQITVMSLLSK